jgi:phosphatidylinositol kinase/protein kinase (PI-3  family)
LPILIGAKIQKVCWHFRRFLDWKGVRGKQASKQALSQLDGKPNISTIEDQNKAGAKALAKISEKLQGYEDSTSGEQQGVEGQVQLLINSARDPDNLCEMFAGWAPWL